MCLNHGENSDRDFAEKKFVRKTSEQRTKKIRISKSKTSIYQHKYRQCSISNIMTPISNNNHKI